MATPKLKQVPAPVSLEKRVDTLCGDFLAMKQHLDTDKSDLDTIKEQLVRICEVHGTIPDSAKKSFRVEGEHYQATASYGVSTSIDQARVVKFAAELQYAGQPSLFKKLFKTEISYVLAPSSEEVKAKLPKKLQRMLARCVVTEAKASPSLKVEEKKKAKAKRS